MKALSLTLLYLGSALFFGVDATKLASQNLAKQVADPRVHSFIRTRDVRDILQLPSLETRRIHTKREAACKLSTCIVHLLSNKLNQWTDSSKDTSPNKEPKEGYGHRRRSFAFLVQG